MRIPELTLKVPQCKNLHTKHVWHKIWRTTSIFGASNRELTEGDSHHAAATTLIDMDKNCWALNTAPVVLIYW